MKSSMSQSSKSLLICVCIWVLIYSCNALPVPVPASQLDINRIIDPLQQSDGQYFDNTRRIKSVFNVPVLTTTQTPKCPKGTQRISSDGECTPVAPKISTDDVYLFSAINNYYKPGKRPHGPHKPNRRRTTTRPPKTTTTLNYEPVATEVITDRGSPPQTDPPFPHDEQSNSVTTDKVSPPPSNSRPTSDPIVFEDLTDTYPSFSTTSFSEVMQTELSNFQPTVPPYNNGNEIRNTSATFSATTEMKPETTTSYMTPSPLTVKVTPPMLKMTPSTLDLVLTSPEIIYEDTTIFPGTERPNIESNEKNYTKNENMSKNFETSASVSVTSIPSNSDPAENVTNNSEPSPTTMANILITNTTEFLRETTMNPETELQPDTKTESEFLDAWTTEFQEMTTTFHFPGESE